VNASNRIAVHCRYCNLNQYETVSRKCRRCGKWLYKQDEDKDKNKGEETLPASDVLATSVVSPCIHYDSYSFWFPLIITALRELNGLSQRQYAHQVGVSRQYLSRIERGHTIPYVRLMPKFTDGLGVSMHRMLELCEACMAATAMTG